MKTFIAVALAAVALTTAAQAASVTVTIHRTAETGVGPILGTVEFQDTVRGLRIAPNLSGLTEGQHGFHVHENPDCAHMEKDGKHVPGLAAGGHYDPAKTGRHLGPDGDGHLGDLPVLYVDADGTATRESVAPRLKTSDLAGRSIMIHAGGDTYSDSPAPLGGGGARAACGVVVY
ncbi:MAG: superoxide dismutase [Cu-Zn] SodC2 [Rhodospirillales bacterium CG15_BIG_FIL_POST_REV_8_21_14_020_66_15]|nr:MAG: superoxide dismutase [Cu-Zn] SodC2 [Rhodospirillales bacterium CG15_BIG_FIL_POST_REV_8_21_14_020_66_15]